MQTVMQDLRYSLRQLIKSPGFTLTAVSSALGIGATTAVFSVIYAALINPYPFTAAARIVRMTVRTKAGSVEWINLNPPQIQQLRQVPMIESVLAMDYHAMTMTSPTKNTPGTGRPVTEVAGTGLVRAPLRHENGRDGIRLTAYVGFGRWRGRPALFRRPLHDEDLRRHWAGCVPPGGSIETKVRGAPYFWLK
jgi:hypothetical protein